MQPATEPLYTHSKVVISIRMSIGMPGRCDVCVQVHAVSTSQAYQSSMLRPDVAARLQAQMSVNVTELAGAKWVFGLLDFDNDGACRRDVVLLGYGGQGFCGVGVLGFWVTWGGTPTMAGVMLGKCLCTGNPLATHTRYVLRHIPELPCCNEMT